MCASTDYQEYMGTSELIDNDGNQIKDPSKWCSNWFLPKQEKNRLLLLQGLVLAWALCQIILIQDQGLGWMVYQIIDQLKKQEF
jgi:hypothetical protein